MLYFSAAPIIFFSELEIDERGDVFAAEFDDELDDNNENQQFDYPRRLSKGRGCLTPEGGRKGVGHNDDKHHYEPQHARRSERQGIIEREIGEGVFDDEPRVGPAVGTEKHPQQRDDSHGDEPA